MLFTCYYEDPRWRLSGTVASSENRVGNSALESATRAAKNAVPCLDPCAVLTRWCGPLFCAAEKVQRKGRGRCRGVILSAVAVFRRRTYDEDKVEPHEGPNQASAKFIQSCPTPHLKNPTPDVSRTMFR